MSRSNRHIELQNMVATWIENRSFKMCGLPEADVVGYVADFVAIAGMQSAHHTKYAKYAGLEEKYMRWDHKTDTYNIFGEIDRWYACVFEVKVSRNDFLNTFGNRDSSHAKARLKPVGTAHWVVAEKGICEPEELPDFWGLLTPYGSGLTEKKMPKLNVLEESKLHSMSFDMLWLQMNCRRSYYEQLRDMSQKIKAVHQAIFRRKPEKELLTLAVEAMEACRGM